MGFVKEPEGVDFVINGKPLTEQQKQAISAFIRADKAAVSSRSTDSETQTGRKRRERHSA